MRGKRIRWRRVLSAPASAPTEAIDGALEEEGEWEKASEEGRWRWPWQPRILEEVFVSAGTSQGCALCGRPSKRARREVEVGLPGGRRIEIYLLLCERCGR